ncbi:hypothetical protein C8035_v009628 [Colletotrichum spinosum]|uniref:Uncharacterized protein n=1 Tax=Colletotrichum spinosum TaxID=1347390 RepID=A0A4R8Q6U9_9PEZI|nr:hypothetical protein C8035_v009628 [Colletotrichum spinosum]
MKPSSLLCALGFVHMGLAMPVPMTISDMVSQVQNEARRFTKITRVSMHRHQPPVSVVKESDEIRLLEAQFDNRPVTPSEVLPPSVVLAAHRPLKTDYLQSLSKYRKAGKDRVVDVVGDGTPETITPMTLKDLLPSRRLPCWKHVQVPKPSLAIFEQHPDLIVLGAVIALVLVLLVLETVGQTFQGVRQHYSPHGQIRLEVDEKRPAPSFRSDMIPNDDEDIERR